MNNKYFRIIKECTILLLLVCLVISVSGQNSRSITGYGNNESNPQWGSTNDIQQRISFAQYTDGISQPVTRPNPRIISNVIFNQNDIIATDLVLSDFTWVFGQFVDHDIALSESSGEPLMNIVVPEDDEHFAPGEIIFMTRNEFSPESGITTPREHINRVTSFLDLSAVYGSDDNSALWLRSLEDGLLKVSRGNMLPWNTIDGEFNSPIDVNAPHMADDTGLLDKLYVAGDIRVNENPLLIAMHTLFVREHNRIAALEKIDHPGWNDERLYQSARRKNIANYQRIVYDEWLPAMGVFLPEYSGYKPNMNPQLFNEFAAAAFRLGHTLINSNIIRITNTGDEIKSGNITLRDAFFNPYVVELAGGIDVYFQGMATQVSQEFDCKVIDDVRNFLFGAPGQGGLDLVSININRGRERGIPDYKSLRESIGMPTINSFSDITSNEEDIEALEHIYGDVNNVDAWVGMLAEEQEEGALFGQLVTTLMERQFQTLREGDRYFYENMDFSADELEEIESSTMRSLLMRNTDIKLMQENVFVAMPHDEIEEGPELIEFPLNASIYPNPVDQILNLKVYSSIEDVLSVTIVDYMGRMISSRNYQISEGNNLMNINVVACPRGYYNIILETNTRRNILKMIKR